MIVEYVTSTLGVGTELHISSLDYKRINTESGWNDRTNLMFAVQAYTNENQCSNAIRSRDLEEAFRHIKKTGTIVLATKIYDGVAWCELYAITEGKIIPVITNNNGSGLEVHYSGKTKREINRYRQEREVNTYE